MDISHTLTCESDFLVLGLQVGEDYSTPIRVLSTLIAVSVTSAWFSRKRIARLRLFFAHWLRYACVCSVCCVVSGGVASGGVVAARMALCAVFLRIPLRCWRGSPQHRRLLLMMEFISSPSRTGWPLCFSPSSLIPPLARAKGPTVACLCWRVLMTVEEKSLQLCLQVWQDVCVCVVCEVCAKKAGRCD